MSGGFTVPDGFRIAELDAFLGELIGGQGMDRAVGHTDGDGLALRKFARECGFPSRSAMREARTALAGLREAPSVEAAKDAHPAFQAPATGDSATARAVPFAADAKTVGGSISAAPEPAAAEEDPVPHAALLKECVLDLARVARESGSKQLAAASDRLVKAHDDLVAGLRSRSADQAKEQRIAELQAELARLRGKPAPSTATTGSPSKQVREWAWSQGLECPVHGRVPQRLRPVDTAKITAARQSRPASMGRDEILIKVTVELPVGAFDPIAPSALIVVPEDMVLARHELDAAVAAEPDA